MIPCSKRWLLAVPLLSFVVSAGLLNSCRSARRALKIGGDAVKLSVKMSDLEANDRNNQTYKYELSGCVQTQTGTLGDQDTVTFSSVGLKQDLPGCQFRIKSDVDVPGVTFDNTEPGVLYFTPQLTIAVDLDGALAATAHLRRLYVQQGNFSLTVPVKFPAPETGKILGYLTCSPEIKSPGIFALSDAKSGTLTFDLALPRNTDYVCTRLSIDIGREQNKYQASLVGSPGKFKGVVGQTGNLAEVILAPQDTGTIEPPKTGQVSVSTLEANCEAPKVYHAGTGECK